MLFLKYKSVIVNVIVHVMFNLTSIILVNIPVNFKFNIKTTSIIMCIGLAIASVLIYKLLSKKTENECTNS